MRRGELQRVAMSCGEEPLKESCREKQPTTERLHIVHLGNRPEVGRKYGDWMRFPVRLNKADKGTNSVG